MKSTFVSLIVLISVHTSLGQIINGSLENTQGTFVPSGGYMELYVGSPALPGWTVVGNSVSWLSNVNPWSLTTPDGSMFLDLTGNHDNGSYGGISQTITTLPSQTYRLSLSLGSQQDQSIFKGPMSVMVKAGAASQSFTFTPSGTGNQWGSFSLDFAATASATILTITGTGSAGGSYLGLDNLQVVPVPEPRPLSILAWGAMFILTGSILAGRRKSAPKPSGA
jgi:hypothetical protein